MKPLEGLLAVIAAASLAVLTGGCACLGGCRSAEDVAELNARVQDENWRRAEPRMRATARRLGARLLGVRQERLRHPRWCEQQAPNVPTPDVSFAPDADVLCLDWSKEDGRAFGLLYERTQRRLLVSTAPAPSLYARLAQRGSTMFVLLPMISVGSQRKETRCVCDEMPRPVVPMLTGFVLDDVEVSSVEYVRVPMTADGIEWECEEVWL